MRPEQVITVNFAPLVLYSFGEQKLAWSECCVGRLTVKNVVFQRKVKSSVTEITFVEKSSSFVHSDVCSITVVWVWYPNSLCSVVMKCVSYRCMIK
jgi:hypothetical protein